MQKRKKFMWGVIIITAIVVIAFSFKQYKTNREKSLQQIRISVIMKSFSQEIESSENRKDIEDELEKDKIKISMYPKMYTEDDIICWWLKQFILKNLKFRDKYDEKMKAVNVHHLLDPVRIQEDMTLEESRDILQKAKNVVMTELDKNIVLIQDEMSGIETLDINKKAKVSIKTGFSETAEKIILFLQNKKQLELKRISRLEDIINFLEEKKDKWTIQEKIIVFYTSDDVQKYNALLSAVREVDKEQQTLLLNYLN